jgi:signal transduction histidine kinase
LLNIAQANEDDSNLKLEAVRMDELLEEAKDIVHNQIPESKLELTYINMPLNADELLIHGNKNLLLIAFENLFENASKFSNNKRVKISLDNTNNVMLIIIKDSGIGIPKKDLSKVLQTFYRAENARPYKGSGIGLALSQKIILLHKGSISIRSIEGQGTILTVQFPKIKIS